MATPGEPYHDLEACVAGLKERGFNSVRIETGLNWAFDLKGNPRGPDEFCQWVAGFGGNLSSFNARGGGKIDVLQRLVQLFRLAKKHGIYVIPTDWEYQDSSSFVADKGLRHEINAIPLDERLMHLARHHGRLIDILRAEGLERQIAFVEIHNEVEYAALPWSQMDPRGMVPAKTRPFHEEALRHLQERNPDILFAYDSGGPDFLDAIPANAQVLNFHTYSGAQAYFGTLWGQTFSDKDFNVDKPLEHGIAKRLLRKDFTPWAEYVIPAQNIREFWRKTMWFYDNLDNEAWDKWTADQYEKHALYDKFRSKATEQFSKAGAEAEKRKLPVVNGEGGFFYPPRLSRFEITPKALECIEFQCALARRNKFWGFMPGTYIGPEHITWQEAAGWLRKINAKFQES